MEAVKVFVRIRPADDQISPSDHCCIHCNQESNSVSILSADDKGSHEGFMFRFDKVFPPESSQEDVFGAILPILQESSKGFDVTIFAYGMTGSGKTYTISGSHQTPGVLFKAVQYVFSSLHLDSSENQISIVSLSYIELYNNALYDLLDCHLPAEADSSRVKLHEHPIKGVIVTGSPTLRSPVASVEEVMELIARGDRLRATSSTFLNERSSRSHAVIVLNIESRMCSEYGNGEILKTSRINLVDLAGSERLKLSGAEGRIRDEACHINKALSCLGDVLNALSKQYAEKGQIFRCAPKISGHVPYRDSKLTMHLKSSLGGHAKTIMLATIRSSSSFYQQSLVTLRYAARTRHIKNVPIRHLSNTVDSDKSIEGVVDKKIVEIEELRKRLSSRDAECKRLHDLLLEAGITGNVHADQADIRQGYEKQLAVLRKRNEDDIVKLNKELKYLIVSKTSIHSELMSTTEKVNALLKQHSNIKLQKEKADLTNAQLHRKLREGQHLINSLKEKNCELTLAAGVVSSISDDFFFKENENYKIVTKDLSAQIKRLEGTLDFHKRAIAELHHMISSSVLSSFCPDKTYQCQSGADFSSYYTSIKEILKFFLQGLEMISCDISNESGDSCTIGDVRSTYVHSRSQYLRSGHSSVKHPISDSFHRNVQGDDTLPSDDSRHKTDLLFYYNCYMSCIRKHKCQNEIKMKPILLRKYTALPATETGCIAPIEDKYHKYQVDSILAINSEKENVGMAMIDINTTILLLHYKNMNSLLSKFLADRGELKDAVFNSENCTGSLLNSRTDLENRDVASSEKHEDCRLKVLKLIDQLHKTENNIELMRDVFYSRIRDLEDQVQMIRESLPQASSSLLNRCVDHTKERCEACWKQLEENTDEYNDIILNDIATSIFHSSQHEIMSQHGRSGLLNINPVSQVDHSYRSSLKLVIEENSTLKARLIASEIKFRKIISSYAARIGEIEMRHLFDKRTVSKLDPGQNDQQGSDFLFSISEISEIAEQVEMKYAGGAQIDELCVFEADRGTLNRFSTNNCTNYGSVSDDSITIKEMSVEEQRILQLLSEKNEKLREFRNLIFSLKNRFGAEIEANDDLRHNLEDSNEYFQYEIKMAREKEKKNCENNFLLDQVAALKNIINEERCLRISLQQDLERCKQEKSASLVRLSILLREHLDNS